MDASQPHNRDREAMFREAFAAHGPALARLARSYEADADKRRDLLQEIHLALWRSLESFDGRCSLRTWTFRIAHNVASSHVIKARRLTQKLLSLEDADAASAASASLTGRPDTERDGAGTADAGRAQVLARLYALIDTLNLIDHAVIVLYLEGEDAAAIAAVTGLTPANVATKIHRIKALLARQYQEGGRS